MKENIKKITALTSALAFIGFGKSEHGSAKFKKFNEIAEGVSENTKPVVLLYEVGASPSEMESMGVPAWVIDAVFVLQRQEGQGVIEYMDGIKGNAISKEAMSAIVERELGDSATGPKKDRLELMRNYLKH